MYHQLNISTYAIHNFLTHIYMLIIGVTCKAMRRQIDIGELEEILIYQFYNYKIQKNIYNKTNIYIPYLMVRMMIIKDLQLVSIALRIVARSTIIKISTPFIVIGALDIITIGVFS